MATKPNFETFLVDENILTGDGLKTAQADATQRKAPLIQVLVEKGFVSDVRIAEAMAKFYKVEFTAGPIVFNAELVSQFPAFTLRRYRIVPLTKDSKQIVVATCNPGDILAADEIRRLAKVQVKQICVTESAMAEALARLSSGDEKPTTAGAATATALPQQTKESIAAQANTAAWIDSVMERAISHGASDLHFEPQMSFGLVRERVDGELYEVGRMGLDQFMPIASRLKLLAGMDIVEKRLAQDGRFKFKSGTAASEVRASTLPTIYGESVVLRILRTDTANPTLALLDAGEKRMKMIEEICTMVDGLVISAGPTGSGKTTTIYAILNALDKKTANLITVEDPVEYELELANQVQINPKIGVTFASTLPSILRQDPDILMVGEMRDEQTTQMVMRAAMSGHLVFSTIHAPGALETVTRMMDMGVELHLIAASLKACMSQRLLRRLCKLCRIAYEATPEEKKLLKVDPTKPLTLYKPKGCEKCHDLGYRGRFAVMEILMVNEEIRQAVVEKDRRAVKAAADLAGFETMRVHAAQRVIAGDTSLRELVANCP